MGIPGVRQKALKLSKKRTASFFEDGDFYVDGMNFAQRIAGRSDSSGTQERSRGGRKAGNYHESPYTRASRLVDAQFEKLLRLNPRSITLVIDAMIGEEKFLIRISRAEQKLRKAEAPMGVSEIMADRVVNHYKQVRLVYSGTEAEDEIMKLIDEDKSRGSRRQFVFSDDSDVFRFNISNPAPVEVVPLVGQKLNKRQAITTINLEAVLKANLIPKKMRVFPPIERLGVSTINPKSTSRGFLEFINCGNVHHRFFMSLGPLLIAGYKDVPLDISPFDAGHEIRRAAYGYVMDKYFKNRPDVNTSRVEEWRQDGFKMKPVIVEPLAGETLRLTTKVLKAASLAQIVGNQLEEVSSKYAITKREIEGVVLMVEHLKTRRSQRRPTHSVTDRTHRLFILVKAIFKSVVFWEQTLRVQPKLKGMDMQISPHHLQSYLNNSSNTKQKAPPSMYLTRLSLEMKSADPRRPAQLTTQ